MKFYCGIDLSARDCHVCVINEQLQVQVQQKMRNELPKICRLLEPYQANLKIVVESTFNWYWLIDGLQAAGFEVVLAHTLGLYLITGAKVKTDRRDTDSLAKLLLVGAVPKAYIYPVETRPVRDLLRRRMHFVQVRAGEYGSLRRLLLRQGILSSKQQEIKTSTEAELEQWFTHPLVRLHASQELQRIELYSQQIAKLEKTILAGHYRAVFSIDRPPLLAVMHLLCARVYLTTSTFRVGRLKPTKISSTSLVGLFAISLGTSKSNCTVGCALKPIQSPRPVSRARASSSTRTTSRSESFFVR
jgi:transposase